LRAAVHAAVAPGTPAADDFEAGAATVIDPDAIAALAPAAPLFALGFGKSLHDARTAVDGQLAEMLKMTNQAIALCMRIPPQILGLECSTYSSAELLMQDWISKGLGFTLNLWLQRRQRPNLNAFLGSLRMKSRPESLPARSY
jgi:hypothetical protein